MHKKIEDVLTYLAETPIIETTFFKVLGYL